jgi:DNA processing protein
MLPPVTTIARDAFKDHPLLSRLLELHDVPKEIHIKGALPNITIDEYGRATPRILTVVGSRKYSTYGRQALEMLLTSLSGQDVVIISGLALGIDSLAHKSALTNNLLTISVPGSGLDEKVLYPNSHRNLAQEIIDQGGALISELPNNAQAAPWTFPMRNRVMAALSDAVLFIEAEEKSGTLITARQALELGRDIGAVPGDIFSPTSYGTNMLIREGAYAITSPDNLFDLLHLSKKSEEERTKSEDDTEKKYSSYEKIILENLREPRDKDTLFALTQLSFEDFIAAFSSLELNGHVEETFGEVRRLV